MPILWISVYQCSWWNSPNQTARLLGRISVCLFGCGCACACCFVIIWVVLVVFLGVGTAVIASNIPQPPPGFGM